MPEPPSWAGDRDDFGSADKPIWAIEATNDAKLHIDLCPFGNQKPCTGTPFPYGPMGGRPTNCAMEPHTDLAIPVGIPRPAVMPGQLVVLRTIPTSPYDEPVPCKLPRKTQLAPFGAVGTQ